MTPDNHICSLAANCQRALADLERGEDEGDEELLEAASETLDHAARFAATIDVVSGTHRSETEKPTAVDRVSAALVPGMNDPVQARRKHLGALAQARRAKDRLDAVMQDLNDTHGTEPLADYIAAAKNYGVALIAYAESETNWCLATLPTSETGRFLERLDLSDGL